MVTIGVQTWGTDVPALLRYWHRVDDLGYGRLVYGDGLGAWTHDGWTTLGAMAVTTRRVRIGPAVTYAFDATTHHPSWLAKRAVAVDHLSGGRLDLRVGVGAGDRTAGAQWAAHGIQYPAPGTRLARLAATLTILSRLWTGEVVDGAAGGVVLRAAQVLPRPIQRPGPPVWVAAMGPRALALAARVAQGWEASYLTPAALAARRAHVERCLAQAGRPPESLRCSVEVDVVIGRDQGEARRALGRFRAARGLLQGHTFLRTALAGTPSAVRGRIRGFARAGATDLMVGFADFPDTAMLELFAETVLPGLAQET
jgi:alkanesulfonate monooxygenase SsuD/methylene tetrahydromethanopterin reductase-like flavin-dependent oxidoreductase (luciferase family)